MYAISNSCGQLGQSYQVRKGHSPSFFEVDITLNALFSLVGHCVAPSRTITAVRRKSTWNARSIQKWPSLLSQMRNGTSKLTALWYSTLYNSHPVLSYINLLSGGVRLVHWYVVLNLYTPKQAIGITTTPVTIRGQLHQNHVMHMRVSREERR